nr:hypothetical protein [Flavobacterium sp. HSC-32F16]
MLYKSCEKWTQNQKVRAQMLFNLYPDTKTTYNLN